MRARMESDVGGAGAARMNTPAPGYGTNPGGASPASSTVQFTPKPYGTPQPHAGGTQALPPTTPQPYGGAPQPYPPQPYGAPHPYAAATPQPGQPPYVTTGAPIARTFDEAAGGPKKRGGLYAGLAAGAVVVVIAAVFGVKAMNGKHEAPTAASPSPSAPASVAIETPPPAVSLTPPGTTDPGAASAPTADSASAATPTTPPAHGASPPPAAAGRGAPHGGAAPPPATPPPKKPAAVDLGI
jgi:hypothetical protein